MTTETIIARAREVVENNIAFGDVDDDTATITTGGAIGDVAELLSRIAALEEALGEAVDEWASYLNCSPNIRSRKRLDEVRALLEHKV